MKKRVVFGVLGSVLDARGKRQNRWKKWRPSVSLCQHPDLPVDRFELLYQQQHQRLAEQTHQDITATSPQTQVVLHTISIQDPWDFEEVYTQFHAFAQHYPFDTEHEEYLVHITTGTHVIQICWFLLTEARYLPARLVQTAPAPSQTGRDPTASPAGIYSLIDLDLSRYDRIASRFQHERQTSVSYLKAGITTRNHAFNTLIEQIERVAMRSTAPMLLTGPTGAGKSFLARRIYQLKLERHQFSGPFVEVNCATLRGDAAMSALFGHVRGAFTGAQHERAGLLRSADGGMLFLDEIGELGLDEQAMLLKAIEEKTFFPFGSDREVSSHFQLIAGTHRDLRQWVAEGKFRADLYARINMWTYPLPGLAERLEDIEPNLEYELVRFSQEYQQHVRFNLEARRRYLHFATSPQALWSGNFRQLSASITRMATLAEQGRINENIVEEEIERLRLAWSLAPEPAPSQLELPELDLFERSQLLSVLEVCRNSRNLSEAGRQLFAVSRQQKKQPNDADRLRKYLARFGLSWEQIRENEAHGRQ